MGVYGKKGISMLVMIFVILLIFSTSLAFVVANNENDGHNNNSDDYQSNEVTTTMIKNSNNENIEDEITEIKPHEMMKKEEIAEFLEAIYKKKEIRNLLESRKIRDLLGSERYEKRDEIEEKIISEAINPEEVVIEVEMRKPLVFGSGFVVSANKQKAEPIKIMIIKRQRQNLSRFESEALMKLKEAKLAGNEEEVKKLKKLLESIKNRNKLGLKGWLKMGIGNYRRKYFIFARDYNTSGWAKFYVVPVGILINVSRRINVSGSFNNSREFKQAILNELESKSGVLYLRWKSYPHILIGDGKLQLNTTIHSGLWFVTFYSVKFWKLSEEELKRRIVPILARDIGAIELNKTTPNKTITQRNETEEEKKVAKGKLIKAVKEKENVGFFVRLIRLLKIGGTYKREM